VTQKRHVHPTRETLIATTSRLLETLGAEDLKVETVLSESGVSSGSLYHHFSDLADLIDHAMIARFATYADNNIEALIGLADKARDREALSALLGAYNAVQVAPDRAAARKMRVQVVARATTDERFRTHFLAEQDRIIAAVADLARELQTRGLVDSTLDPTAIAMFFLIYNIGLVLNDLATDPAPPDALLTVMSRFVNNALIAD